MGQAPFLQDSECRRTHRSEARYHAGATPAAVMDASNSIAGLLYFGLSIVSLHRCQPQSREIVDILSKCGNMSAFAVSILQQWHG